MEIDGVFEGGGVRGIALAGAAAATLDRGYSFHRAVGTSAGALVAALLVSGYGPDELAEEPDTFPVARAVVMSAAVPFCSLRFPSVIP